MFPLGAQQQTGLQVQSKRAARCQIQIHEAQNPTWKRAGMLRSRGEQEQPVCGCRQEEPTAGLWCGDQNRWDGPRPAGLLSPLFEMGICLFGLIRRIVVEQRRQELFDHLLPTVDRSDLLQALVSPSLLIRATSSGRT